MPVIAAVLVSGGSSWLGVEIGISRLEISLKAAEARITAIENTEDANDKRLRKIESDLSHLAAKFDALDRNTKIAANEALDNGKKIDDLSRDLNRLIGAFEGGGRNRTKE